MKAKQFIIVAIATVASFAYAGPSVGGGGDVVILPDDSVVLADPFIDSGAPQPNNMPPLRAMNPRILQVINLYNKASSFLIEDFADKESDINLTLAELATRNNDLRFYGVQSQEELNQFCAPGGRKIYKLPNGAMIQQVACTAGNETFIVEPLFIRLSLRDQGLLLIHERLTTLRDQYGGKNYSAIARFTTGLNLYLSLYKEQIKKKYRVLTESEQKLLSDFYIAIEEIEKRNSEVDDDSFQWIAHKNGGGRVHVAAIVDDSAFISLDSVVTKGSEIAANTSVKEFYNDYRLPLVMEEGASVEKLSLTYYTNTSYPQYNILPTANSKIILKARTKIKDVILGNLTNSFTTGEDSKITNTTINSGLFSSGKGLVATGANIGSDTAKLGGNVVIVNSSLYAKKLNIDNNAEFDQVILGQDATAESFSAGSNTRLIKTTIEASTVAIGTGNNFQDSTFKTHKGSFVSASDVNVRNSNVVADHFNIGTQSTVEDSVIVASVLKLGSKVEFKDAKIDHSRLSASIANEQKLISNGVYSSTYAAYYPLGFVPKAIDLTWNVDQFRCVYTDKPHTKTQTIKKEFLNGNKDGVLITGTSLYQGKVSPFIQEWNYDIQEMKVRVLYKSFTRADDKNLLMISHDGKFVNPDYKRESLVVSLNDLPGCMQKAIADKMNDYFQPESGSLVIPSDLASR